MRRRRTNGLRLGLWIGGAIVTLNVAIVMAVVWTSDSGELKDFETAATAVTARSTGEPLVMVLRPYPLRVRSAGGPTAVGYVTVKLRIDDRSREDMVCHRLPKIVEVLTLSLGRTTLSRQDWYAVTGPPVEGYLRDRFNNALKANYVERVYLRHGRKPENGWACESAGPPATMARN